MELAYSIVFLIFSCNSPVWATIIEDDVVIHDGTQEEVIQEIGEAELIQILHDDFTVLHMIDLKEGCND